ncbi:DUF5047 domain-containing protein [Streptomyces sp. 184]|uniref:DUF5047 domain-containing protein n=1 Tax=Streptomyces sp. 184 TaxID=1827526 RepID=UPI0038926F03
MTVDRGAAVRRTATVEVPDVSLLPWTAADYLAISGARLRIRRGIVFPGGLLETVPVFFGRLDTLAGDPDTGPVTLTASGLEAVIADAKFEAPYSTRGATAAVTSITALIQDVLPDAVIASTADNTGLGTRTWDREGDRWAAVQEIATAVGAEAYCNADGLFVIAELPDILATEPAWEVAAGASGVLIEANREFSRDGMYNVVVASGENTEDNAAAVTATAMDDDPTSPTYYLGPFGRVPRFYSSPTLTSSGLAQGAANKLLRDSVKPAVTADLTSLPNPCLEPGDVLRAVYGNGRRDLHQVQSFSIDLSPGGTFALTMIGGKEDA